MQSHYVLQVQRVHFSLLLHALLSIKSISIHLLNQSSLQLVQPLRRGQTSRFHSGLVVLWSKMSFCELLTLLMLVLLLLSRPFSLLVDIGLIVFQCLSHLRLLLSHLCSLNLDIVKELSLFCFSCVLKAKKILLISTKCR